MRPSCPGCGSTLRPVAVNAATAPWLCSSCRRGWWPAELTPAARSAWDPARRTHGHGQVAQEIRAAVADDVTAARARGVSTLASQLRLLDDADLDRVKNLARGDLLARAQQEEARRSGNHQQ